MEETEPICQRCKILPATRVFDWPEDMLTTLPPGASSEDYLPAYERLCDQCFHMVFHLPLVESLEEIENVFKRWGGAKRLVDGS